MADRDRGLLLEIFLVDARESLVVLEGSLGRVTADEPEASRTTALARLLTSVQRLKGTATFLGFVGLAELAGLAEEVLEETPAPMPDDVPRLAGFLGSAVPVLRRVVQAIADRGEEDAEAARLARTVSRPPPAADRPPATAGRGDAASRPAPVPAAAEVPAYFVAEAGERLDAMVASLAALERGGVPADAIAHLLRTTHTLKGAAYTVGSPAVGDLAHALESLLVEVREERLPLTPAVVDSALAAIDTLRLLVDAAPADPAELAGVLARAVGQLRAHVPVARPEDASGAPAEPAGPLPMRLGSSPAAPAGRPAVRVAVEHLDAMLNLVGELLVARTRLDAHLAQLDRAREALAQSRTRMGRAVQEFDGTPPAPVEATAAPLVVELPVHLELERYDDADVLTRRVAEIAADLAESETQLGGLMRTIWDDAALVQRLTDRLRDEVVQVRLVPLGRLFPRVARQVREAARATGKTVLVEVAGESVEVDNAILEQIADPLLHLAQNAVTHGIEGEAERRGQGKPAHGTVRLRAEHRGSTVAIHVGDDGRGIDPDRVRATAVRCGLVPEAIARRLTDAEALELVYLPGFTTAAQVTTASGRGVGMDVVRTGVTRLHGEIALQTRLGVGTTFTLSLPLTLLVLEVLMVGVGSEVFGVPLKAVQQVLMARPEWIRPTEHGESLALYVETVEVIRLDRALGLAPAPEGDRVPVVVLRGAGRAVAVVVSEIHEKEAIVVKGLGPLLEGTWPFAGATIAADGRVILVLDANRLLQPGGAAPPGDADAREAPAAAPPVPRPVLARRRVMLVDDSVSVRKHVGEMLERAGLAVVLAADGVEARERLAETPVDVVVTDLEMPRMNGFELIQALRQRPESRELPVVVLTTRAGSKYLNLARWLGASHYVAKPVDEGAFVALVRSLAEGAAAPTPPVAP